MERDTQVVIPALVAGLARGTVLVQIPVTSTGMTRIAANTHALLVGGTKPAVGLHVRVICVGNLQ